MTGLLLLLAPPLLPLHTSAARTLHGQPTRKNAVPSLRFRLDYQINDLRCRVLSDVLAPHLQP